MLRDAPTKKRSESDKLARTFEPDGNLLIGLASGRRKALSELITVPMDNEPDWLDLSVEDKQRSKFLNFGPLIRGSRNACAWASLNLRLLIRSEIIQAFIIQKAIAFPCAFNRFKRTGWKPREVSTSLIFSYINFYFRHASRRGYGRIKSRGKYEQKVLMFLGQSRPP